MQQWARPRKRMQQPGPLCAPRPATGRLSATPRFTQPPITTTHRYAFCNVLHVVIKAAGFHKQSQMDCGFKGSSCQSVLLLQCPACCDEGQMDVYLEAMSCGFVMSHKHHIAAVICSLTLTFTGSLRHLATPHGALTTW